MSKNNVKNNVKQDSKELSPSAPKRLLLRLKMLVRLKILPIPRLKYSFKPLNTVQCDEFIFLTCLNFFKMSWHVLIFLWKCKDNNENARTKMKMQGQKGKCKDDIKSYSLDRFEQVERSKTQKFWTKIFFIGFLLFLLTKYRHRA